MGNDLHQASTTENNNVIGYGPEGCQGLTERQMSLYVVSNTLVNEAKQGTLVRNFAGGSVTVANNLLFGEGSFLSGEGTEINNFRESLRKRIKNGWGAPTDSGAIDNAIQLPSFEGISVTPTAEFEPPVGYRKKTLASSLDAGSRENPP
jgi:hypothetical protein